MTTSWPRDDADFAGRFLVEPIERLRAAGCTIDVLAPGVGFRDFGLAYGDGVMANLRRRPWLLPLLLASMAWSVRRAARSADLVHAHWLLLGPIAWLSGRPVVLTLHGSGTAGALADLEIARRRPRLFRWLVRRARVVVGVSQPLASAAAAGGAHDAELIPHGISVPATARELPARPTVLFAGRLSPEKGVVVLADALDGVTGVDVVVAGDGPLRELFPDALGFVDQARLHELYRAATMLVLPSFSEGFGVVALEAMSHGVPVVATNVGGLGWLVNDDVNGLIVAPGDPVALRAAIERLRDDPALCARLGAAGRERAREQFGWERITAQSLDAYRRAVAGG